MFLEALKQRILAKAPKIKRFDQRIEQHRINRLFQHDEKQYQQLNAETESSERPGTEVSKRFWSNIWGTGKSCNKNSGWLKELRSEKNEIKHCKIQTTPQMVA